MNHRTNALIAATIPALVTALGIFAAGAAQAVPTSYFFQGNCTDCAAAAGTPTFEVSATLVLQDYVEGTPLADPNFVSFAYSGSNLLDPYRIDAAAIPTGSPPWVHGFGSIAGNISFGAPQVLDLGFGDGLEFKLDTNGNWFTCGIKEGKGYYAVPCSWQNNNDQGTGAFNNPIPEPGTYALMGLGLLGMALARHRTRRST